MTVAPHLKVRRHCGLCGGSAQSHQALATLDGVTDSHQDALDGSIRRGIDLGLHLHGLEGQENLTSLDGVTIGAIGVLGVLSTSTSTS